MFYIGQKVVCVNDKVRLLSVGLLKKDEVYTIESSLGWAVMLVEIKAPEVLLYLADRFTPYVSPESKAFAEELLQEITIEINEENLIEK